MLSRVPRGAFQALRGARAASTQTAYASYVSPTPIRTYLSLGALLVGGGLFTVYYLDSRAAVHRYVAMPLLRALVDPETAHVLAVKALATGWTPRDVLPDDEVLQTELWDLPLSNPIGVAAGLDKNAEAIDGLFDLGFGYVEVGSVTPQPQPGNPRPRYFRLPEDDAIINRYGFNSQGHARVVARLRARLLSYSPSDNHAQRPARLLAVNLGKNKSSPPDDIDDYLIGVRTFGALADVLVVNVSSPNTPGLRELQGRGMLEELLGEVVRMRDALDVPGRKPRVVVKIAPDLTEEELMDVAAAVRDTKVDGVIMGNTTVQRPKGLKSAAQRETGGLSGSPLRPITMQAFQTLRSLLPASVALIGCGGISSGADALEYARLGANTVQLYTSLGYEGVGTARRIKDELAEELRREGKTWQQVVQEGINTYAWRDTTIAEEGMMRLQKEAEVVVEKLKDMSTQMALGDELALPVREETLPDTWNGQPGTAPREEAATPAQLEQRGLDTGPKGLPPAAAALLPPVLVTDPKPADRTP